MRAGYETRRLEGQQRRALEKLSAEMVRCAHRAIYGNTTGRGPMDYSPPAETNNHLAVELGAFFQTIINHSIINHKSIIMAVGIPR